MAWRKRTAANSRGLAFLFALVCAASLIGLFGPSLAQTQLQVPSQDPSQQLRLTPEQILQLMNQPTGDNTGVGRGNGLNTQDTVIQPALNDRLLPARPAPPSRLEQIMSRRSGVVLKQFGYDQLGTGHSVTLPQVGAAQDDYLLGPGDEIVVSLRGQENSDFRLAIDRDGRALLPKLPPIAASGRTIGDFRRDVQSAVHRAYVATDAFVTVGHLRQISVFVSGEVNNPGIRIVTGLASAIDVILLSGGIKKTGSLRNIHLMHNGRSVSVDLYGLLLQRGGGREGRLADGDRVIVPALGATIAVAGWVRRPGIYELGQGQGGESVSSLIATAGGLEVRGTYRISLLHLLPDGRQQMTPVTSQATIVRDGDVLYAEPGASGTVDTVTLSGSTALAGRYSLGRAGKLSDLLRAPGALGETPYTSFGIIVRRDPKTYLRTLVAFTPLAVLQGHQDMDLKSDDLVRVFSMNEGQLLTKELQGHIAQLERADEQRRNPLLRLDQPATLGGTTNNFGYPQAGNAGQGVNAGQPIPGNGQLAPGQGQGQGQGQFPGQPAPGAGQQNVAGDQQPFGNGQPTLNGFQQTPGTDFGQPLPGQRPQQNAALPPQSDSLEELNVSGGRVATNQDVQSVDQLASQLGIDSLILLRFLADHQTRVFGAVLGNGLYIVGPNLTVQDLIQAAGGTLRNADLNSIELTTTTIDVTTGAASTGRQVLPLDGDVLARYEVKPGDQFWLKYIPDETASVAGDVYVQGEVRFPGAFQTLRGEHLSDLLARAGGLTQVAYPYGTVFLRKSAAILEREGYQRAAKEVESELMIGLTRSNRNQTLAPETFVALQSFVTKLENQRALGRISVIAEPTILATRPDLDPLLEPGDVIYIPQRPSTVSVLGEVKAEGSFTYTPGASVGDYIQKAGGYGSDADRSEAFVVLPDGSARSLDSSWLSFDNGSIPPGSSVVVPRDLTSVSIRDFLVDATNILSQLAVTAASLSVISKN